MLPRATTIEINGIKYLSMIELLESKLAHGLSHVGRLKHLADALELIRVRELPADLALSPRPPLREKYLELWTAVQIPDPFGEDYRDPVPFPRTPVS